jgi:hypothetical protein
MNCTVCAPNSYRKSELPDCDCIYGYLYETENSRNCEKCEEICETC